MKRLALFLLLAACKDAAAPNPPPHDPYVVGWITDSLTAASPLYASPVWALFIEVIGADAQHSGISNQSTFGRLYGPQGHACINMAGQLPGERELEYVALGDTIYTFDDPGGGNMPSDTAFWRLVGRLSQGADTVRAILDSARQGLFDARIPGLVVIGTGRFDPTASSYGRGNTPDSAIVRHWNWTDTGRTFAEDTAAAGIALCDR